MADLLQSSIESFQHLPTSVERPVAAAAVVGATALALVYERWQYNRSEEKFAVQFPNPSLLEASIQPNQKANRRARLAAPLVMTIGGGMLAAYGVAGVHYSSEVTNHDAAVVVVEDVSNSMLLTKDVGDGQTSRLDAVNAGIREAAFDGRLGIIQSAADSRATMPISRDWRPRVEKAQKPHINPNGGLTHAAIEDAVSILPTTRTGRHEGTVLVLSDGSIESTAKDLAESANEVKKSGAQIKIIVPGSTTGEYNLPGSTVKAAAGANGDKFAAAYGDDNVVAVNGIADIKQAVQAQLTDASKRDKEQPWRVPLVAGAVVLAAGVLKSIRLGYKRMV